MDLGRLWSTIPPVIFRCPACSASHFKPDAEVADGVDVVCRRCRHEFFVNSAGPQSDLDGPERAPGRLPAPKANLEDEPTLAADAPSSLPENPDPATAFDSAPTRVQSIPSDLLSEFRAGARFSGDTAADDRVRVTGSPPPDEPDDTPSEGLSGVFPASALETSEFPRPFDSAPTEVAAPVWSNAPTEVMSEADAKAALFPEPMVEQMATRADDSESVATGLRSLDDGELGSAQNRSGYAPGETQPAGSSPSSGHRISESEKEDLSDAVGVEAPDDFDDVSELKSELRVADHSDLESAVGALRERGGDELSFPRKSGGEARQSKRLRPVQRRESRGSRTAGENVWAQARRSGHAIGEVVARQPTWFVAASACAAVVVLLATFLTGRAVYHSPPTTYFVVERSVLLNGPAGGGLYPTIDTLGRGERVTVHAQRGPYYLVEDGRGRSGFVRVKEVARQQPAAVPEHAFAGCIQAPIEVGFLPCQDRARSQFEACSQGCVFREEQQESCVDGCQKRFVTCMDSCENVQGPEPHEPETLSDEAEAGERR